MNKQTDKITTLYYKISIYLFIYLYLSIYVDETPNEDSLARSLLDPTRNFWSPLLQLARCCQKHKIPSSLRLKYTFSVQNV